MKVHHYLAIIVRLFAVFLFLFSLKQTGLLFESALYGIVHGMTVSAWVPFLSSIPWFVASAILWIFPLSISKKLVPADASESPENISPVAILSILLSAMSVYFLYYAIIDVLYWITYWQVIQQPEYGSLASMSAEHKANIAATALEMFASLVLLFNSKRVATWLRSVG